MQSTIKSSKCSIEAEIRKDQLMIFCYHQIYDNVVGVVMVSVHGARGKGDDM